MSLALAAVLTAVAAAAAGLAAAAARAWAWARGAAEKAWLGWHAPPTCCAAAAADWTVRRCLLLSDERPPGRIDDLDGLDDAAADDYDDDDPAAPPPEPDARVDATTAFDPDAWADDGWELLAREAAPELARLRAELRYVVGGRKHRVVLRPGDRLDWPLYETSRPGCRLPRGVMSAVLVGHAAGDRVDVTARVRKYAGPHADFYASKGLRVRLRDMFPSDSGMGSRFRCLRVVFAGLQVRDFGFELDPIIAL